MEQPYLSLLPRANLHKRKGIEFFMENPIRGSVCSNAGEIGWDQGNLAIVDRPLTESAAVTSLCRSRGAVDIRAHRAPSCERVSV